MKAIITNGLPALIVFFLHGWIYRCALIDEAHTFDFKVFPDRLPLLPVVSSIVFSGIALTAPGAFLLRQKFNLNKRNSLISYVLISLLWCFSAFTLYYPNNGMDNY